MSSGTTNVVGIRNGHRGKSRQCLEKLIWALRYPNNVGCPANPYGRNDRNGTNPPAPKAGALPRLENNCLGCKKSSLNRHARPVANAYSAIEVLTSWHSRWLAAQPIWVDTRVGRSMSLVAPVWGKPNRFPFPPGLPTKPWGLRDIIERLAALPSDEFLSRPKLSTRDSFASHQAQSPGMSCHRC